MSTADAAVRPPGVSRTAIPSVARSQAGQVLSSVGIHAILLTYTIIATFPIVLTIINSFKKQGDIFGHPYTIPFGSMFSTRGYDTVFQNASAFQYVENRLIVKIDLKA